MKRVRLSRKTWINSLINICFRRPSIASPLLQPLVEAARGYERQYKREDNQWNQIRIEHSRGRSLEKDFLQYGNVVARRDQYARDPLQRDGHLLDGKQKSRQQKRWKKFYYQRNLTGRKLVLCEYGNQESHREHYHRSEE